MKFLNNIGLIEYFTLKNILIYLIGINLLCFILMFVDKKKAMYDRWRIPEKVLITIGLLGGSIGGIIGMHMFRHKTQKIKFYLGYPAILIFEIIVISYLLFKY